MGLWEGLRLRKAWGWTDVPSVAELLAVATDPERAGLSVVTAPLPGDLMAFLADSELTWRPALVRWQRRVALAGAIAARYLDVECWAFGWPMSGQDNQERARVSLLRGWLLFGELPLVDAGCRSAKSLAVLSGMPVEVCADWWQAACWQVARQATWKEATRLTAV